MCGVFDVSILVGRGTEYVYDQTGLWRHSSAKYSHQKAGRLENVLWGLTECLITFPHFELVPSSPIITTERLSTA